MEKLRAFVTEERRLLLAVGLLVVLMNVPYGRYGLYPFMILSTWVHEMCHGVAALVIGGGIDRLEVYPDGSGLAFTRYAPGTLSRAWVASAGYLGTSVLGALLLVFRRRPLAGRLGVTLLGLLMVVSTLLFVRNLFGFFVVPLIGAALLAVGLMGTPVARFIRRKRAGGAAAAEPARAKIGRPDFSGWLFGFVAATLCLNAVTSIHVLFSSNLVVNGTASGGSDAHTVADALLLPYWFWASLWLVTSIALMLLALRFTLPGRSAAAAAPLAGRPAPSGSSGSAAGASASLA